MATEFNNIFLNINRKPSPKSIMVAIPMNMYRVETNEFSHGLNFFQKTVLKFKARPGIKDQEIADYIGLDSKLISIVVDELNNLGFINEHGSLNNKGKEKLWEIDGLTVNSDTKKIGYVLQYVNQDKLYQYFINKLIPVDLVEEGKNRHPKVITGTKGDGEDYTESPFFLDELFSSKLSLPKPNERAILQLITNSNKKKQYQDSENENSEKLLNQLAIRFLNDQPELIWICTYIYLQERDDKTYEADWRVLDPFGYADNVALKFYLNEPINKKLLDKINTRFAHAKTIEGKIHSDYHEHLDKLIDDKLSDFDLNINQLDNNLRLYIISVVKNYILLDNSNTQDKEDIFVLFILTIQKILENILKQDREFRSEAYEYVKLNFSHWDYSRDQSLKYRKEESINDLYSQGVFSRTPQLNLLPLIGASKGNISKPKSLLSYLAAFMLTYNFNCSPLFKVLKERVGLIIEVAQLRNEKGHGQTSTEKSLRPFSKEEVEKYYSFIKSLINDYIQNQ